MKDIFDDRGFTLLEVLVAVMILSAAMAVLFPIIGASPGKNYVSAQHASGLAIAENKLREQLALQSWSDLDGGATLEGDIDEWHWELTGREYDALELDSASGGQLFELQISLTHSRGQLVKPLSFRRVIWRRS